MSDATAPAEPRGGRHDVVDTIAAAWRDAGLDLDTSPIHVIGRILRGARLAQALGESHLVARGLVRADFDILSALRRLGRSLTPGELSTHLLMSPPSTTQRLKKLEAAGWVRRSVNPNDRRGFLIQLTESGRTMVEELIPEQLRAEAALLAGLSGPEQQALAEQLRNLLLQWESPFGDAVRQPR